jgi:hypothetical protein
MKLEDTPPQAVFATLHVSRSQYFDRGFLFFIFIGLAFSFVRFHGATGSFDGFSFSFCFTGCRSMNLLDLFFSPFE